MERTLRSALSSVSVQPGQYLCVDSRPGTSASSIPELDFTQDLNSYSAKYLVQRPATQYISLPFKHSQEKRSQKGRMIDVGNDLRERALTSLSETRQLFTSCSQYESIVDIRKKTFITRHKQGRLLPLLGIPLVKGPKISQCIGITAGNRLRADKRIHNTRKDFHSKNITYKVKNDSIDFLARETSIHRNSFNSSNGEEKDNFYHNESIYGDSDALEVETREDVETRDVEMGEEYME